MINCLNQKINSNKAKHLLVENEIKKLKTFGSSYFLDECYLLSDERITAPNTSD